MIIHDFDLFRVTLPPYKADSPLVIDPQAMLSLAIPFQGFQPVGRGKTQILQVNSGVECVQSHERSLLNVVWEVPHELACEDFLRISIAKRANHSQ
jgi:hypothetical protein